MPIINPENGQAELTQDEQQQISGYQTYQQGLKSTTGAIDPNAYGGNADQMAAAVSQAQYNEWRNNFLPVAQQLNKQTTYGDPSLVSKGITQAIGNVNQAYDTASGQQQRFSQEYGVTQDPMLGAVTSRVNNVQRSQSVVDAANRIRSNLASNNNSIMSGGQLTNGGVV